MELQKSGESTCLYCHRWARLLNFGSNHQLSIGCWEFLILNPIAKSSQKPRTGLQAFATVDAVQVFEGDFQAIHKINFCFTHPFAWIVEFLVWNIVAVRIT